MNTKEINARKSTMTEDQIVSVRRMIRQGYSANAIARECSARPTIKQVNAVFAEYNAAANGKVDLASTGNID